MLMASDNMPGQKVNYGNGNFISIATQTIEVAKSYFSKLSDGGQIIMPFDDTFLGAKFGMFTDKYGVGWMVNCEVKK
ncbi:MAG: hypothetical protein K8S16_15080 [Bacteroidales bacterium]|nr:hypothetical protein [Bacteroidales bacterium]